MNLNKRIDMEIDAKNVPAFAGVSLGLLSFLLPTQIGVEDTIHDLFRMESTYEAL